MNNLINATEQSAGKITISIDLSELIKLSTDGKLTIKGSDQEEDEPDRRKSSNKVTSKRWEDPVWFDRFEAAEYLHITPRTLWSYQKTDIIPCRRLNRKLMFLKSDLDRYLMNKRLVFPEDLEN